MGNELEPTEPTEVGLARANNLEGIGLMLHHESFARARTLFSSRRWD